MVPDPGSFGKFDVVLGGKSSRVGEGQVTCYERGEFYGWGGEGRDGVDDRFVTEVQTKDPNIL